MWSNGARLRAQFFNARIGRAVMATTWVIVADSARARVLEAESANGPLTEVDALVHPASRLHPQKITSDLPGRSFDRGGQGRHAMESQVDPRRHEQVRFATELAHYLGTARTEGRFERLVIIAGPAFTIFHPISSVEDGFDVEVGFPVTRAVETAQVHTRLGRQQATDARTGLRGRQLPVGLVDQIDLDPPTASPTAARPAGAPVVAIGDVGDIQFLSPGVE